ncbi:MAG: hypothetical protein KGL39_10615 [Patescibacteria group bacterium]|nr:hypothetical protein [Patescibacteria group bacterium]
MSTLAFVAPLAFTWFTHEHGLFVFGILVGFACAAAIFRWEVAGWCSLFALVGAGIMALAAHFLHWWR